MPQPHITLGQIRARTAQQTFSRGEGLYLNKAISETALRGNVIEGICEAGSQPDPYHVQATITKDGIIEASCNCMYDFEGDCKHVVALLLTYLNNPTRFEKREPVADTLESRDKADLIALIKQMVKRYPDLKTLIDRPVPGKATAQSALDTKAYRKELRKAFREEREWGGPGAETAVASISEAAQAFALADDWRNASTIYRMIIEECLANTDYFYEDQEGWYAASIDQVIAEMGTCLDHLANEDSERKALLNSLMDFYVADIDTGGDLGVDVPDIILRYARKDDIANLRSRVKSATEKAAHKAYSDWTVQAYTEFLAELDLLDEVDPEIILARLRTEEMYSLLVSKLIEFKRTDEAIAVIREHIPPFERLQELMRLVVAGYKNEAVQLAEEGLKQHYDQGLVEWLIYTLQMQGDTDGAFRWQIEQMKSEPDIAHYSELKTSSMKLNNWPLVRPTIIEQLEKAKEYAVLTRVYLAEEDWDKAWSTLPKARENKNTRYMDDYDLEMDVARATLQTHPKKALAVYIRAVRAAIDGRSRERYQVAAQYLVDMRDTYDAIDEYEVWEKLIADIRGQKPRLPALLDELKKAGL